MLINSVLRELILHCGYIFTGNTFIISIHRLCSFNINVYFDIIILKSAFSSELTYTFVVALNCLTTPYCLFLSQMDKLDINCLLSLWSYTVLLCFCFQKILNIFLSKYFCIIINFVGCLWLIDIKSVRGISYHVWSLSNRFYLPS